MNKRKLQDHILYGIGLGVFLLIVLPDFIHTLSRVCR
jgi:hypothetical protein